MEWLLFGLGDDWCATWQPPADSCSTWSQCTSRTQLPTVWWCCSSRRRQLPFRTNCNLEKRKKFNHWCTNKVKGGMRLLLKKRNKSKSPERRQRTKKGRAQFDFRLSVLAKSATPEQEKGFTELEGNIGCNNLAVRVIFSMCSIAERIFARQRTGLVTESNQETTRFKL